MREPLDCQPYPRSKGRAMECLGEVDRITSSRLKSWDDPNVELATDKAREWLELAERYANTWLLAVDPRDSDHYCSIADCREAARLARLVLEGKLTCDKAYVPGKDDRKEAVNEGKE